MSIVDQLSLWSKNNATMLCENGIELVGKFPGQDSSFAWKASIGLIHDSIVVSYTVWERTIFQTELIILNVLTKKTIVMADKTPESAQIVRADLDEIV